MTRPFFFGFGSLVNRKTHIYDEASPARLQGWRRVWRTTHLRPESLLSIEPCADVSIQGLIAHVPNGDWSALDTREIYYERTLVTSVAHSLSDPLEIASYVVPARNIDNTIAPSPILLSYLDVVVHGYLDEFGSEGVRQFFDTTVGWNRAITNDRANPGYPRHQSLPDSTYQLIDRELARIGLSL